MPHGHCYLWKPSLVSLHLVSDILIGIAYLGISFILYTLVRRVRLPFSGAIIAFGIFIAACSATHFMEVLTLWKAEYWWAGFIKAITAVASIATCLYLIRLKPKILEMVRSVSLSNERKVKLERAHNELELLYERIKQLDELKTRFFSNVSHELRTPLTLILGPLQKLLSEGKFDEGERRSLIIAERNSRLLLKQVNDLLDISKIDAGKMKLNYSEADLISILKVVAGYFQGLADEQKIKFDIDLLDESGKRPTVLTAQVDVNKFEKILVNLLSNAFKFTPGFGQIHVYIRSEGGFAKLGVEDSGPGVSPELGKVIFDRFRQGDESNSRKFEGSGLGLSIVKEFVDLHHGQVSVGRSSLGGACFRVALPLQASAGASIEKSGSFVASYFPVEINKALARSDSRLEKKTMGLVLVVEDNFEMSEFISDTLSETHRVIQARNGAEALELIQRNPPDLIVTDVMMPLMSGDAMIRGIRKFSEFDLIPIIVLTAKADKELRVSLLKKEVQDYLVKPFHREELQSRVGNWMMVKKSRDALKAEVLGATNDLLSLTQMVALQKKDLVFALDGAKEARREAEDANRAKGDFLKLVSHELRTPFAIVDLAIARLQRHPSERLTSQQSLLINQIASTSKHAESLIESILQYSRLESGKVALKIEDFDVPSLVSQSVKTFEKVAREKKIGLRVRIKNAKTQMSTDPLLVRVILDNLISNAIKFTIQGSVEIQIEEQNSEYRLTVFDTGPGISQEDQGRIFKPFQQLGSLNKSKAPGMGLGLALVRKIVSLLHGEIRIDSQLGVGSRFILTLPVKIKEMQTFGQAVG